MHFEQSTESSKGREKERAKVESLLERTAQHSGRMLIPASGDHAALNGPAEASRLSSPLYRNL